MDLNVWNLPGMTDLALNVFGWVGITVLVILPLIVGAVVSVRTVIRAVRSYRRPVRIGSAGLIRGGETFTAFPGL